LAGLLLPGYVSSPGKKWLLRPEQIGLTAAGDAQPVATIQEVHFCGSHYLLELESMGQLLLVRTSTGLTPGTRIGLTLLQGEPCLI
jgi:hypothetical protein